MTDEQWKQLIVRTVKAHEKANSLREQAEQEYERRYGQSPSDVDDDWWIDTITAQGVSSDAVDMEKIKSQAEMSCDVTPFVTGRHGCCGQTSRGGKVRMCSQPGKTSTSDGRTWCYYHHPDAPKRFGEGY